MQASRSSLFSIWGTQNSEQDDIRAGDRFSERRPGGPTWIVEKVSNINGCAVPHASVRREDFPDIAKTISVSALMNNEEFAGLS